jgi:hypothetical protein
MWILIGFVIIMVLSSSFIFAADPKFEDGVRSVSAAGTAEAASAGLNAATFSPGLIRGWSDTTRFLLASEWMSFMSLVLGLFAAGLFAVERENNMLAIRITHTGKGRLIFGKAAVIFAVLLLLSLMFTSANAVFMKLPNSMAVMVPFFIYALIGVLCGVLIKNQFAPLLVVFACWLIDYSLYTNFSLLPMQYALRLMRDTIPVLS